MNNHLLSFIPQNIHKVKTIKFLISLKKPNSNQVIDPINNVNNHKFKPRFIERNDNELLGYCASMDVAHQTIEAISLYCNETNISSPYLQISNKTYVREFAKETNNLPGLVGTIDAVVLSQYNSTIEQIWVYYIGRNFSYKLARDFLKAITEEKSKNPGSILPISVKLRNYAAKTTLKKPQIEELEKQVQVTQILTNPLLETALVSLQEKKVLIMQRPWGKELSKLWMDIITNLDFKGHKNIFLIGGCAGLEDAMKVDDIFIPKSCSVQRLPPIHTNKIKHLRLTNPPYLENSGEVNVFKGKCYTVHSSIENRGLLKELKLAGVSAVEMELGHLLKKGYFSLYPLFYVMDIPVKGIGLSETYYDKKEYFRLIRKLNRGKHVIYYNVIDTILEA